MVLSRSARTLGGRRRSRRCRRPPAEPNGNGMNGGLWKWIAAIVGALLVGLTPFLLTQNAQRDYAQKDDLAALAATVNALSERVARNEEQTRDPGRHGRPGVVVRPERRDPPVAISRRCWRGSKRP